MSTTENAVALRTVFNPSAEPAKRFRVEVHVEVINQRGRAAVGVGSTLLEAARALSHALLGTDQFGPQLFEICDAIGGLGASVVQLERQYAHSGATH
jgi:hypothetical protein